MDVDVDQDVKKLNRNEEQEGGEEVTAVGVVQGTTAAAVEVSSGGGGKGRGKGKGVVDLAGSGAGGGLTDDQLLSAVE